MTLGHRPDIYVTTTACSHTYGISSKQRTKLYRLSQIAGTYSLLATQYEYYATVIRYSGCTSQAVRHHLPATLGYLYAQLSTLHAPAVGAEPEAFWLLSIPNVSRPDRHMVLDLLDWLDLVVVSCVIRQGCLVPGPAFSSGDRRHLYMSTFLN